MFLCKCTCCFTIIFILPCRSALLYKKETTDTKRGELHQDDLDKCNKFPNKIRIADRKSTTIVHVCEGSPRAALVNISASYTGFTQLFTFQYSNSSLITCYPHPTPKTHSPNNTGFCTLQSTWKSSSTFTLPVSPAQCWRFCGQHCYKQKHCPPLSPKTSRVPSTQPQNLHLQSWNSTQVTTERPGHEPAPLKLSFRCQNPGKESKATCKEPKSFPAENRHLNTKYRQGSTLSTSPSRSNKDLDKENRILISWRCSHLFQSHSPCQTCRLNPQQALTPSTHWPPYSQVTHLQSITQ